MQNSIQTSKIPLKASKLTKLKAEQGFAAIVTVMAVIALGLIFSSGFLSVTAQNTAALKEQMNSAQSYYASESGVEDAIYRIKNGKNIGTQTVLTVGSASATTTISTIGTSKTILAEGGISSNVRRVQTTLSISATQSDFTYGVQIGQGGITMKQNSVVNGSVYSNGSITCSSSCSGSKVTGDAWVAGAAATTTDQLSVAQTADFNVGNVSSQADAAQSFIPSLSNPITQVSLYIKKVGNPANATVRITTTKSGAPNNTSIASGTLNATSVTTSYGWIDVGFSTNPTLTAGTTYWIVLDTTSNASNYWTWGYSTANPYVSGQAKYTNDWSSGGASWSNVGGSANSDFAFKVYLGAGTPTQINGIMVGGDAHANTIASTQVCGDAYYTTIDGSSLTFLNAPGSPCSTPYTNGTAYTPSADPPQIPMPISQSNIASWEADAAAGGTVAGPYSPASGSSIGPIKVNGDLNLTSGTFTITGAIWVSGNITVSNNANIVLAPSFGALSTVVVADNQGNTATSGMINVNNNVNICGSAGYNSGSNTCNASNGSYIMFLSTYSNTAGIAIQLQNNSVGAIFYSSAAPIDVSNNASAKQLTGWGLELENNAAVTYESGLQMVNFSSGPSAGWVISNWQEVQ